MNIRETRILDEILAKNQAGMEMRQTQEDGWIGRWEWYMNTKQTKGIAGQQWTRNDMHPDSFSIVEQLVPQDVMGMLQNRQWFSVEAPALPPNINPFEYRFITHQLIGRFWSQMDGVRKTVLGMKKCRILGHITPKMTWEVKVGERSIREIDFKTTADGERLPRGFRTRVQPTVEYMGPRLDIPDNFKLLFDPSGRDRWFHEIIPASLHEMEDMNKKFGGTLYKNLPELKAGRALGDASRRQHGSFGAPDPKSKTLEEIVQGIPSDSRRDKDHVSLQQCWGLVTSVKYPDTQWRLIVVADDQVVIRDEPANSWNLRPPYWNVQSVPIPDSLYGESILTWTGPLSDLRSQIENMRRDELLQNIHKSWIRDTTSTVKRAQLLKYPGVVIDVTPDHGKSAADSLIQIPNAPVLQDAYTESGIKEKQMHDIAGTPEAVRGTGITDKSRDVSGTEAGLIGKMGGGRINLNNIWMNESYKKPILETIFHLIQTRMEQDEQVNTQDGRSGGVNMRDLQYPVHIRVDPGTFGSMDQFQLQALQQTLSMALAVPEGAMVVDLGEAIREVAYRSGLDMNITRSKEQVAEMQNAQQQQAKDDAVFGTALETSGKIAVEDAKPKPKPATSKAK